MKEKVLEIWPEINWIKDETLRNNTLDAWVYAIEQSPLEPKDLEEIPFSLLIKERFSSLIDSLDPSLLFNFNFLHTLLCSTP